MKGAVSHAVHTASPPEAMSYENAGAADLMQMLHHKTILRMHYVVILYNTGSKWYNSKSPMTNTAQSIYSICAQKNSQKICSMYYMVVAQSQTNTSLKHYVMFKAYY